MAEPGPPEPFATGRRADESELVVAIFRTAIILMVVFSPVFRQNPTLLLQISVTLAGVYNLGALFLYWRNYNRPWQRPAMVGLDLLLITIWVNFSGTLAGRPLFPLYYIEIVVAGLWFGVWGALLSAAAAAAFYLGTLALRGGLADVQAAAVEQIPYLFLIALFVSYVADIQDRQRRESHEAHVFLAQHQERIRLAQHFDDLLRPRRLPEIPGLEVGVRVRPAGHSGAGDYHDFLELGPDRWGVVVGDVGGKYEPGLIHVPVFKYAMRVAARTNREPGEVLQEANRLLFAELQPDDRLISLAYAIVEAEEGIVHYAVAGQEMPFVIPSGRPRSPGPPIGDMVIGVYPETSFRSFTTRLEPGDAIIFFTDGAIDVTNAAGEELGVSRLEVVARQGVELGRTAQELTDHLLKYVNDFARGGRRRDDITLVALRRPPRRPEG